MLDRFLNGHVIAVGGNFKLDNANHLPAPVSKGGVLIRCRCEPGRANDLARDIAVCETFPKSYNTNTTFTKIGPISAISSAENPIIISDDDEEDSEFWREASIVASKFDDPAVKNGPYFSLISLLESNPSLSNRQDKAAN